VLIAKVRARGEAADADQAAFCAVVRCMWLFCMVRTLVVLRWRLSLHPALSRCKYFFATVVERGAIRVWIEASVSGRQRAAAVQEGQGGRPGRETLRLSAVARGPRGRREVRFALDDGA